MGFPDIGPPLGFPNLCCFEDSILQGPKQVRDSCVHIPSISTVPCSSSRPQPNIDNYLGLCIRSIVRQG